MAILMVYLALVIQLVAHEAAHAHAMRRAGVRVVEAGLGLGMQPRLVYTDRRGFRWSLSVWLFGAYVKPHPEDWKKIDNAPHVEAAWQFNAGIVTNLVLGAGALAAAAALAGHPTRALILAAVAAVSGFGRKLVAAYVLPALGPPLLGYFLWSVAVSLADGRVVGMTGFAGWAPRAVTLITTLGTFGALGMVLATINAVPMMPMDNARVWDRLLRRQFGNKVAQGWGVASMALLAVLLAYSVFTDILNITS